MKALFFTLTVLALALAYLGVCYPAREETRRKSLALGLAAVLGFLAGWAFLSIPSGEPQPTLATQP